MDDGRSIGSCSTSSKSTNGEDGTVPEHYACMTLSGLRQRGKANPSGYTTKRGIRRD
jgi:hypothetical protein